MSSLSWTCALLCGKLAGTLGDVEIALLMAKREPWRSSPGRRSVVACRSCTRNNSRVRGLGPGRPRLPAAHFEEYFFIMNATPLLANPRQASSLKRIASSHSSTG